MCTIDFKTNLLKYWRSTINAPTPKIALYQDRLDSHGQGMRERIVKCTLDKTLFNKKTHINFHWEKYKK
ncbi:hypothetical protein BpHYR1_013458 [Brachionus plicatilis]|uniref:Uncharacterized protein n=1 Tax=Brachionus plicatilis TaxID=10195 RepID=A0A3M7QUJ3_BRAPC|nr:hypothetical protein BpHYR1_013458 [Brachionus plicatilis]